MRQSLALAGASVVGYVARAEAAEAVVRSLHGQGARALAIRADVGDSSQASALVAQTVAALGRLDVRVNNAGITRDSLVRTMVLDDWHEVIRVDLDGVFNCTKAAIPYMVAPGSGKIVTMSSIIGQIGSLGQANDAAAKAGVIGFTKAAALELARYGILVNALRPGLVESDTLAKIPPLRESLRGRIPLQRFGQPRDVARAVLYLVTVGEDITGQTINLNGGLFSLVG